MAFLIAHKDDCQIVINGPTCSQSLGGGLNTTIATPCTCGGMKVKVDLSPIFGADGYELDIPTGGTPS